MVRGLRNKNPLNIEKGSIWVGLVKDGQDKRFCEFERFYYGYRAAFNILLGAYRKRGWNTISEIIEHWAPASENQTTAYIKSVYQFTEIPVDKVLCRFDYIAVVMAMAKVECGSIPDISECIRAGVERILEVKLEALQKNT